MIKLVSRLDEVLDFTWELCQDELHASYPRLESIEQVEKYIERAIATKYERIIACYREGILCGVCVYFWEHDEKYAQTTMFLIKDEESYDEIADEFLDYLGEQLKGYKLLIGVPFSNLNAKKYFQTRNIECIESSIDTRLYKLKSHINPKLGLIDKITQYNFKDYAEFHDKYALPQEMYYTSKNLEREMKRFRIFVFKENETIQASIFAKIFENMAEIFGLFIDEKYKGKEIEKILLDELLAQLYKELGAIKEVIYFIDEGNREELNSALAAGFNIIDTYRCYKCVF